MTTSWIERNIKPVMQSEAADVVNDVRSYVSKYSDHDGATLSEETIWRSYERANSDGTPATIRDVGDRMIAMLEKSAETA